MLYENMLYANMLYANMLYANMLYMQMLPQRESIHIPALNKNWKSACGAGIVDDARATATYNLYKLLWLARGYVSATNQLCAEHVVSK